MFIYIDESGSINNKINSHVPFFVITLVRVKDKTNLKRVYKRFVSSNMDRLKELDKEKLDKNGRILKAGGKMFDGRKFKELKGTQFDPDMKRKFLEYFTRNPYFEIFYICVNNSKISDQFCSNTARCFNYVLRLALEYFISNGLLPDEDCYLQLDERNEKTDSRFFLENYLNTELVTGKNYHGPFNVTYFDSSNNQLIQIADVFSNIFFSHLTSGSYRNEIQSLKSNGFIKYVFEFPLSNSNIS